MKRITHIILTFVLAFAALIAVRPAAADGESDTETIIGTTCNSVTITGQVSEDNIFFVNDSGDNLHIGPTQSVPAGSYTVTLSFTASPGSTAFASNDVGPADVPFIVPSCGGYQGPGIPAGFVLQIITCNTPVFTTAGGKTPSGTNAITAGQTWFVNPKPVIDAKGNSWTEIFVSSYVDPFIPTSCLGGAPAH